MDNKSSYHIYSTKPSRFKSEVLQYFPLLLTGRLTITSQNGRNLTSGEYDALYTFGGRSFSIWRADNMYLVYDSDADIGLQTAQFCPDLFNSKVDESKQVRDTMDSRSDDKVV